VELHGDIFLDLKFIGVAMTSTSRVAAKGGGLKQGGKKEVKKRELWEDGEKWGFFRGWLGNGGE